MRRALVLLVAVSALAAGCTDGTPPVRHHRARPSPAATLAIPDYTDTLRPRVLRGPSEPPCPRNHRPPVTRPAEAWDVNGDGRGDVTQMYAVDEGGSFDVLHVLLTSPQGKAACDEPVVFHLYQHGVPLTSGDFNGDGYADIATSYGEPDEGINVIPGGPTGLKAAKAGELRTPIGFAFGLATGDLNRDGFTDLAADVPPRSIVGTKRGSIIVVWGGPQGLRKQHSYRLTSPFHGFRVGLAIGDVNGDGYPDLLNSADGRLAVAAGGPRGPRHPRIVGPGYGFLEVGDVTGDGIDDVAASHPGGRGRILLYVGRRGVLASPVLVAPGVGGLPGHRHRRDQFSAAAIVPGSGGRPGVLVATGYRKAPAHEAAVGHMWLIPGSRSGISPTIARVISQSTPGVPGADRVDAYFASDVLVRNVVGDSRPELLLGVSAPLGGYLVLPVHTGRVRGYYYARLPAGLSAEDLPLALR